MIHKLDDIGDKYQDDDKECCNQMLSHWLDNFEAAKWNNMFRTLKQTGHSDVVTTVKRDDRIKG